LTPEEICQQNGHTPFKDKRVGANRDTVCTVCKTVLEKAEYNEVQSPYQPGVAIRLRDEEAQEYRLAGIQLGEGTLIGDSPYGGDYYICEFVTQDGKPEMLTLAPVSFYVVDNTKTKAAMVDAVFRNA
jgi:hypothetical protein